MKWKPTGILLTILMGVFLLINSPFVWKLMYPIKFEAEIQEAAKRFSVDPLLVLAIIRTESNFDHSQSSRKGAIGLMQVMPQTASWVISQAGFDSSSEEYLDEPKVNIDIGTWYLAHLLKQYNGNVVLSLAAYNAGPGNVNTWVKDQRWDGTKESIDDIPYGETRHYVQRVLYYHERYNKVYGTDFAESDIQSQ